MSVQRTSWTLTLVVLSIAYALQLTMLADRILYFVNPSSTLLNQVLLEWRDLLWPEWETLLYRLFVISAIAIYLGLRFGLRKRSLDPEGVAVWQKHACVEVVGTALLLCALWQRTLIPYHALPAQQAWFVVMLALMVYKLFYLQMPHVFAQVSKAMTQIEQRPVVTRTILYLMGFALIVLVIFVPNPEAVVARFFIGEQFRHADGFMYGPLWAYMSGALINWQVISEYGVGMPVLFAQVVKLFGPLSYESVFAATVTLVIIYYGLWFWFVKRWLGSVSAALIALVILLKVQLFHPGINPFVFTYCSATPFRFWFDVIFFIVLWAHVSKPCMHYLFLLAVVCGLQLFYITSEGVYLTAALWFYIGASLLRADVRAEWIKSRGSWFGIGLTASLPLMVAFSLLMITVGHLVFTQVFWLNTGEFIDYFLSGFGLLPMSQTLLQRDFWAWGIGFVMIAVYMWTILAIGGMYLKRMCDRRWVFVVVLGVYGLAMLHYYIARSAQTSYYVVAHPFVMILGFWLVRFFETLPVRQRRAYQAGLLVCCLYALFTNHLFRIYPNVFNPSRNPVIEGTRYVRLLFDGRYFNHLPHQVPEEFKLSVNVFGQRDEKLLSEYDFKTDKELVAYYKKAADFSIDEALIRRLTKPNEPVALISSFETKMLMEAKRRPYFYYFPLVLSRPMTMRTLVRTSIFSTHQLKRVLDHLSQEPPEYIFVEKVFLTPPQQKYYNYYGSFMFLMDAILKEYQPDVTGQYLIALKRKIRTSLL